MDKKIPLVAVIGPTASGKTGLAVKIAEKFGGDTKLSAALVSITTLLSIITMPVIVGFAMNM